MINFRYDSAFSFEKESQSTFGLVNCCSGCFSAYRTSAVRGILDRYENQTFLGRKCTFGDDRHLTNLILEKYKVITCSKAKAYTYSPTTIKGFIKQNRRWKCSFIRENFFTMKYMFKKSFILSLDIIMMTIYPLFSLLARVVMLFSIFIYPILIPYYLSIIILMTILHNPKTIKNVKNFIYGNLYSFFHILYS